MMDDQKTCAPDLMFLLSVQLNGCRSPCFLQILLRSDRHRLLPRKTCNDIILLPRHSYAKLNQDFKCFMHILQAVLLETINTFIDLKKILGSSG